MFPMNFDNFLPLIIAPNILDTEFSASPAWKKSLPNYKEAHEFLLISAEDPAVPLPIQPILTAGVRTIFIHSGSKSEEFLKVLEDILNKYPGGCISNSLLSELISEQLLGEWQAGANTMAPLNLLNIKTTAFKVILFRQKGLTWATVCLNNEPIYDFST